MLREPSNPERVSERTAAAPDFRSKNSHKLKPRRLPNSFEEMSPDLVPVEKPTISSVGLATGLIIISRRTPNTYQ